MNTVLVVEDDALIGSAMEQWLTPASRADWVRTLAEAQSAVMEKSYDIIILDLGLPDGHGFTLLKMMKRKKLSAGVLILTAYGDVENRIEGLDYGADDFLVKPVDFNELDARIRSILRRKDGHNSAIIEHLDVEFDVNARTASKAGEPIDLSKMEVNILSILMQGKGRYYSKRMLEERLYENHAVEGNAIEVHISSLRKKLGKLFIKTTRGLGYIIEKNASA